MNILGLMCAVGLTAMTGLQPNVNNAYYSNSFNVTIEEQTDTSLRYHTVGSNQVNSNLTYQTHFHSFNGSGYIDSFNGGNNTFYDVFDEFSYFLTDESYNDSFGYVDYIRILTDTTYIIRFYFFLGYKYFSQFGNNYMKVNVDDISGGTLCYWHYTVDTSSYWFQTFDYDSMGSDLPETNPINQMAYPIDFKDCVFWYTGVGTDYYPLTIYPYCTFFSVSNSSFNSLYNYTDVYFNFSTYENGGGNFDYWTVRAEGYNDGYDNGYIQGKEDGINESYEAGYDTGYQQGLVDQNPYTFNSLFGAVADTPILIVRSLFDFDFFGVNVLTVVLSLFTAFILFYLFRKLF